MTQKELSEKAGIGLRSLARYETNERFPSDKVLNKLATALNTSTVYLKGVDSISDFESIRQLFILIEESGFFSIGDLQLKMEYDKNEIDHYYMTMPITKKFAATLAEWKAYTIQDSRFGTDELAKWKQSEPYSFNLGAYNFPDAFPTNELLSGDWIDYKLAICRLENKQYTSNDFVDLLILLNNDAVFTHNPASTQVQEYRSRLLNVFSDQNQPQDLINSIFTNERNNPMYSRLEHGIVRDLYEQTRK